MRKILPILLLFFIPLTAFRGGVDFDTNAKIQAVFIYNFTKYIEWPKDYRQGDFTVGILGSNPGLFNQLKQMAQFKKVANQQLVVEKFNSINDVKKCNILFVTRDKSSALKNVIKKVHAYSTLIVTSKEGLANKALPSISLW